MGRTAKYQVPPDSREAEDLVVRRRGDIVAYGVPGTPPMAPGQYMEIPRSEKWVVS
jgi:hypothetical protein